MYAILYIIIEGTKYADTGIDPGLAISGWNIKLFRK